MNKLEQRIAALEARLALVEHTISVSPLQSDPNLPPMPDKTENGYYFLKVTISNKRYDPVKTNAGTHDGHIWFDCLYTPTGLKKATRAIKGVLEFSDHFGDVIFRIKLTINESIHPGRPTFQRGGWIFL